MSKLIKMPSINQFRNIVNDVKRQVSFDGLDENGEPMFSEKPMPTVTFVGTIKLHGTNASVCYDPETDELWAQSKGNVITPEKDNAGFAKFVQDNFDYFHKEMKNITNSFEEIEKVCVYGEWAGKGIQKGVAIAEIDKTFFMFGIKFKTKDEKDFRWAVKPELVLQHMVDSSRNIRSIFEFTVYEIDIDFENVAEANNKLIEITDEVEKECPVGKSFGISGVGEGIVWVGWLGDTRHCFKVKGEKHSNSKVKKLKPVDEEKEKKKIAYANLVTPAWRLEQMFQETFDTLNGGKGDVKRTGDFLRAVVNDVRKEESDLLEKYDLTEKDVNPLISKIARRWFMDKLDEEAGI